MPCPHFLLIPDKMTLVEKFSHTGPRKKYSSIFFQNCQFSILIIRNSIPSSVSIAVGVKEGSQGAGYMHTCQDYYIAVYPVFLLFGSDHHRNPDINAEIIKSGT